MANNEVSVTKIVDASIEKAYSAFADASVWSIWFSENTKIDLREGGRFSNADGDSGKYLEILPNQLLRFTWENGHIGEVEICFKELSNSNTEITLRHSKLTTSESAQKMQPCWTWTLDNLETFLQTGRPLPFAEWKTQKEI
jgi:uncharacterized protein YndB with AHSA1/START domain